MKPGKTINERLAQVRVATGFNPNGFANELGISRGFLDNIEAGRKKLSMELAVFLTEKLHVSPNFIMLGRGPIFLTGNHPAPESPETANLSANPSANLSPASKTKRTKNEVREEDVALYRSSPRILVVTTDSQANDNISLVDTRVAAGYAAGGFIEPEFMRQLPTFSLPDKAFRNGTFRAFQVTGDSMLPTLYEGDWVICRYIEQWDRDIRDNYVHVIVTEERPLVKRLLNRLTERGQISLLSDNPAVPTQFIDGETVREVWVAVGRLSRQFANPTFDIVKEVSRTRSDVDELMAQFQTMQQQLALKPV